MANMGLTIALAACNALVDSRSLGPTIGGALPFVPDEMRAMKHRCLKRPGDEPMGARIRARALCQPLFRCHPGESRGPYTPMLPPSDAASRSLRAQSALSERMDTGFRRYDSERVLGLILAPVGEQ